MSNCSKSRKWAFYYIAVIVFAVSLSQSGESHGQISGFISALLSGE
jgi:hypothetical protein